MDSLQKGKNTLYLLLLLLISTIGLIELVHSASSLDPRLSVRKDFAQEYLMARAVLDGKNPYLPLPELGASYSFPDVKKLFPHPSAHPPFMALLGTPFALLSYYEAAVVWFVLELVLIAIACLLLTKWWSRQAPLWAGAAFTLALFTWEPVFDEMIFGQLNALLLLLITCAWLQLRRGKEIGGGLFIGLAVAIKLLVWPIALYLLLRGKWLSAMVAGATAVLANLIALVTIGPTSFFGYFTEITSAVLPYWRAHEANFSLWSLGWRLFDGAHGRGVVMNQIAPLLSSYDLAVFASTAIPCLFLVLIYWLVMRIRHFDLAFGVMICTSILFSPVTWSHYLLMTLIPIATAFRILAYGKFPWKRYSGVLFLSVLAVSGLVMPGQATREAMTALFATSQTIGMNGQTIHHIPFTSGLLTLIPLIAVLSLIGLLCLLDSIFPAESIPPDVQQISQHLQ